MLDWLKKKQNSKGSDVEMLLSVENTLLQALVDRLKTRVASLEKINKELEEQQIGLRDMVAADIFSRELEAYPDPVMGSKHAYEIADVFMRIRETGQNYTGEEKQKEVQVEETKSSPGKSNKKSKTNNVEIQ